MTKLSRSSLVSSCPPSFLSVLDSSIFVTSLMGLASPCASHSHEESVSYSNVGSIAVQATYPSRSGECPWHPWHGEWDTLGVDRGGILKSGDPVGKNSVPDWTSIRRGISVLVVPGCGTPHNRPTDRPTDRTLGSGGLGNEALGRLMFRPSIMPLYRRGATTVRGLKILTPSRSPCACFV